VVPLLPLPLSPPLELDPPADDEPPDGNEKAGSPGSENVGWTCTGNPFGSTMLGSASATPIAPTPTPRTTLAAVHRARKRPPRGGRLAQHSPKTVFPNMKPPSKQEAPIVRGDGANKNGEFQGRPKKSRTAGMGAP